MEEKKYTIDDLCDFTGFTRRTIRYYVEEGLLDPPAGRGRGGFYFDIHLERLREIKALQERGLKLHEITVLLLEEGAKPTPAPLREIWIRYPVAPGVEIHVSRDMDEAARSKLNEVIRVAKTILEGGEGNE